MAMQEYYYSNHAGNIKGSIFLESGLPDMEVANEVSLQFGVDAVRLTISQEAPPDTTVSQQQHLENVFNQAFFEMANTAEAVTWATQRDLAQKLVLNPKDKVAAHLLMLLLTQQEKDDAKSDNDAVLALAKKILNKSNAHAEKILRVNGLRRQAAVDFTDAPDEEAQKEIYIKYSTILYDLTRKE